MKFTVVGISGLNTRTTMQVDAFDVQDAEIQATLRRPNIRIAGVFVGTLERADKRTNSEPDLYQEQETYAQDAMQSAACDRSDG